MQFVPNTAAALAPILLALAACGGGAEEADEPGAAATTTAAPETVAAGTTEAPEPGETPTPEATPSETPSASPTPTPTPSASPSRVAAAAGPPTVFNQCTACHSTARGENKIGPTLAGVFGRRAAGVPGFEYSQAMKDSGLSWNQGNLDRYLENPRGVVPGTTMAYNGVKDAAQRQALVNYLKTL